MTIREYQVGFELEGNKTFGYSDEFDFYPAEEWKNHSLNTVSIKDDGIYYMVPITGDNTNDEYYGTAEERIYTMIYSQKPLNFLMNIKYKKFYF